MLRSTHRPSFGTVLAACLGAALLVGQACNRGASLYDFDGDGSADGEDCQPDNPEVFPGAVDPLGDGLDQDCDGQDGDATDRDGDGVGNDQDCAPDDPNIHPGATDTAGDGIDQDCDGEDGSTNPNEQDIDKDGYTDLLDCDDNDPTIHPGADDPEGDGIDQNCDGIDGIQDSGPTGEGVPVDDEPSWAATDTEPGSALALGDLDRDGDQDLVVGHQNTGTSVHLNYFGTLEYAASWTSSSEGGSSDLKLADLNEDGYLDLAEVGGSQLRIHWGSSTGFEESPDLSLETCAASAIAVGDANGDGLLDLGIACPNAQDRIHFGQGNGVNVEADWVSDLALNSQDLAFADWDQDGHEDLALVTRGTGNAGQDRIFFQTDQGLETTASWLSIASTQGETLHWGDTDGDGDLDLILGYGPSTEDAEDGGCAIHTSFSNILERTPSWSWASAQEVSALSLGDLDGDGEVDLAAGRRGARTYVFLGDTEGLASAASWQSAQPTATLGLAWADITGNGALDLASIHGTDQAGSTAPPQVFANTSEFPSAGLEGDCTDGLDNDGDALIDCRDHADCLLDPACPVP